MVALARTAVPRTTPVSPSRPLGTSSDSTGASCSLRRAIQRA
jgi:hypothetical protein